MVGHTGISLAAAREILGNRMDKVEVIEQQEVNGKIMLFPKFCTITMDRGDRPVLFDFCQKQIQGQTMPPEKAYFITEPPTDSRKDIVKRVRTGIEMAKADGFDKVIIIESDDYYTPAYCESIMREWVKHDKPAVIGCRKTVYYNLRNNSCQTYEHEFRSSLFTTAFNISALTNFRWPADDESFLDLSLWKYASKSARTIMYDKPMAVGIKHGIGLCGGKGHRMFFKEQDPDRAWLRETVGEEAFNFYNSLAL